MRDSLGGANSIHSMVDPDLGELIWNARLQSWEGSMRLSSPQPYALHVFARAAHTPDRAITTKARLSIARIRGLEATCRQFASDQLLDIHNSEWPDSEPLRSEDFASRLIASSIEVHEDGYVEVHFGDGGLFSGHVVGVRVRPDGSFQEAVIEG